jgi:hypothetical protein
LYPLFFSTKKEYNIKSLFPHLGLGKYNTFVNVFFRTGNFYFFLNLEKNVTNIHNLPLYAYYKYIQKGYVEKVIFSINLLSYHDDMKNKF